MIFERIFLRFFADGVEFQLEHVSHVGVDVDSLISNNSVLFLYLVGELALLVQHLGFYHQLIISSLVIA